MTDQRSLLPAPIEQGAAVGVAALSGPASPEALQRGLAELKTLGFSVVAAENLQASTGFLAGDDTERLAAFHQLLRSDVDAVFFSRGGHGVMRLLDQIDWDLLTAKQRWFVGYSDLTPLLLEITRRTGWTTIHGPMVATDFERGLSRREQAALLGALDRSYRQTWQLNPAGEQTGSPAVQPAGQISGRLVGGCLAMICAALGTSFSPRDLFADAVVFLEDVGEAPYQVDRLMCQLGLCGLNRARAIVFGHCREQRCDDPQSDARDETSDCELPLISSELIDAELVEVLADHQGRLSVPIFHGVEAGHGRPNIALPIGGSATIESGVLTVVS